MNDNFNVPNGLTMTRVILSPLIWPILYYEETTWKWVVWVTLVFAFISTTDFFDGYWAKKWNQCTVLGEWLDPIADKILVLVTSCALLMYHDLSFFVTFAMLLVLLREIILSGAREYARRIGETLPTVWAARVKTGMQMAGLGFMIIGNALDELLQYPISVHGAGELIFILGALLGFHSAMKYCKMFLAILARTELSRRS